MIKSGVSFGIDFSEARRKYFSTFNSILCNAKHCSDLVKLELIERQCIPLLLYCIESFSLSVIEIKSINSWLNMAYRKIFGYHKWESVRSLIFLLGRTDFSHTFQLRRILFFKKLDQSSNSVLLALRNFLWFKREFCNVMTVGSNTHACTIDTGFSVGTVRRLLFSDFESTITFSQ